LRLGGRPVALVARAGHRAGLRGVSGTVGERMLLCVDIGNTNTILAVFEGDDLKDSWRIRTDPQATADELSLTFRTLLDGDGAGLDGIALSSTVPQQGAEVAKMAQRYYPHAHFVAIAPGVR